jgi:hypothetical protein
MGPPDITDRIRNAHRMFKKAVQRGRSERRGDAYVFRYVEPLNDAITRQAGTRLSDFF